MTITYPNGIVLTATVLSHLQDEIRVVAPGSADILVFTRIHETWISEELEPVSIEFEWQRSGAHPAWSEDDCICSKELTTRLIQTLFGGGELDSATGETLYMFSPEGSHVTNVRTQRRPS